MLGLGNSLTQGGTAPNLLLDSYSGASGAFSTRKLSSSYSGNCVKVRNDSDELADIGFSGGSIDSAALETHCGSGDGFVHTWYDQSGNGRNVTTTSSDEEPRIFNSGTYDGGIVFDSNARRLNLFDVDGDNTFFLVMNTSDTSAVLFESSAGTEGVKYALVMEDGNSQTSLYSTGVGSPSYYVDGAAQSWSIRDDAHTYLAGSKKLLTIADLDITSSEAHWTPMYFGNYSGYQLSPATVNEIVIYGSVLSSANQSGVEGHIMAGHGL